MNDDQLSRVYKVLRQLKTDHDDGSEADEDGKEGKEEAGEDDHDDDSELPEHGGGGSHPYVLDQARCNDGSDDEKSEEKDPSDDGFIDNNTAEVDGNDLNSYRALDNEHPGSFFQPRRDEIEEDEHHEDNEEGDDIGGDEHSVTEPEEIFKAIDNCMEDPVVGFSPNPPVYDEE